MYLDPQNMKKQWPLWLCLFEVLIQPVTYFWGRRKLIEKPLILVLDRYPIRLGLQNQGFLNQVLTLHLQR